MSWNISHGGGHGYSYDCIGELCDLVENVASWSQRRALKPMLACPSGDPFEVDPRRAAAFGRTLVAIAGRLPDSHNAYWQSVARQIGGSATRAAQAGETWRWS